MNRGTRAILIGLLAVILVGAAVVFAVGEFWRPSPSPAPLTAPRTAEETALTVDPLIPTLFMDVEPGSFLADQERMAALYDVVVPSVVNIQVARPIPGHGDLDIPGIGGQGSGWIWDTAGRIVTNNHVVDQATDILVFFHDGVWAEAELVATAPQADLAVIQLVSPEEFELRPLSLATGVPAVGSYAVAFGSPFGLAGSMTQGIVSAVGRTFPLGEAEMAGQYTLPEVVQTDAAINPGNSGGPLVDLNGQVIGVNFAIQAEVRANAGVGFAIPASIVRRVVPALIADGAYDWPYLGIGGATIGAGLATLVDLPEQILGVYVNEVIPRGPAARAGIVQGDIITAVDGEEVTSFEDLIGYLITETNPGETVVLTVLRNGEISDVTVTVGIRP
jgi:S1-C subfamily serine protease